MPSSPDKTWNPFMVAIVGTVCTIFLIFSYFHILRRCSSRRNFLSQNEGQRRRLDSTNPDGNDPSMQFQSRGLDSCVIRMIPMTEFKKKINGSCDQGQSQSSDECAVCLGEYEDGEWVKTIPNCSHVFHVSCIDIWFQTHSSCPLCRSNVLDVEFSVSVSLGESLIRDEVHEERSAFYQVLRSQIMQNSNLVRLEMVNVN